MLTKGVLLALLFWLHSVKGESNVPVNQNNNTISLENESLQPNGTGIQCASKTVQCVCGIGDSLKYTQVQLEAFVTKDPFSGMMTCSGYGDPYLACSNISCTLAPNNTWASDDGKNFMSNFYPKVFTISKGEFPEGHHYKRQSEPCRVTPLKNAEIKCYKWPNWMNCDISCIHGHALRVGEGTVSSTNINCRSTENKWKPHGFYDCEPYLNCKVHLVKPGDLKCKQPTSGPTYCDISCLDYEDKEATSKTRYECVDENFSRNLPHCAVVSDNAGLVRKPK